MLFNSFEFAIFLPITFLLYWFVLSRNLKYQNAFLVAVSYLFYGWWDYRFLALIIGSSLIDFIIGNKIHTNSNQSTRKFYLLMSICVNLGFLGFFKYFNFFADSFTEAFTLFGQRLDVDRLNIILPVGISFYTFQTLSYSIDIYRNKMKPTNDIIAFFAFVSFFPQLVAGPIERASNLLPQFYIKRTFDYGKAVDGMRQILWGLFKKIVIADNCASYVNLVFNNYEDYSGSTLLLGIILFSLQIYCDFSGYSDIAIGTSKLFGFNLMRNFAFPYFSRNISEFWKRWHISLSTWFRDYVYIPIGGSRVSGNFKLMRNVMVIFIVSGFWHGANWTFLFWGFLNGLYILPILLRGNTHKEQTPQVAENTFFPSITELIQILTTYSLTCIAWIFFRSETISDSFGYIQAILSQSLFSFPEIIPKSTLLLSTIFIFIEWVQRKEQHALQIDKLKSTIVKFVIYYAIISCIATFTGNQQEFIYFQF